MLIVGFVPSSSQPFCILIAPTLQAKQPTYVLHMHLLLPSLAVQRWLTGTSLPGLQRSARPPVEGLP